MSYRYIVSTVTNRLHPWWDEGASQVPLRTENSEGIYQDPKLQVSQVAAQCRACMQGIQMFFMKSGYFCFLAHCSSTLNLHCPVRKHSDKEQGEHWGDLTGIDHTKEYFWSGENPN